MCDCGESNQVALGVSGSDNVLAENSPNNLDNGPYNSAQVLPGQKTDVEDTLALTQSQAGSNFGSGTIPIIQPLSNNGAESFLAPFQFQPVSNDAEKISTSNTPFLPEQNNFAATLATLGQFRQDPNIVADTNPSELGMANI